MFNGVMVIVVLSRKWKRTGCSPIALSLLPDTLTLMGSVPKLDGGEPCCSVEMPHRKVCSFQFHEWLKADKENAS